MMWCPDVCLHMPSFIHVMSLALWLSLSHQVARSVWKKESFFRTVPPTDLSHQVARSVWKKESFSGLCLQRISVTRWREVYERRNLFPDCASNGSEHSVGCLLNETTCAYWKKTQKRQRCLSFYLYVDGLLVETVINICRDLEPHCFVINFVFNWFSCLRFLVCVKDLTLQIFGCVYCICLSWR